MRGFRNGFGFVRLSARLAFYAIITKDSLHFDGCDKLFKANGCVTAAVVRACDGRHTMCVAVTTNESTWKMRRYGKKNLALP